MMARHELWARRGKLRIHSEYLNTLPPWLWEMLTHLVVIRAEYMLADDELEYHALSEFFQRLRDGQEAPIYRAIIEDGSFLRFE